jgi:hypothetical protein
VAWKVVKGMRERASKETHGETSGFHDGEYEDDDFWGVAPCSLE